MNANARIQWLHKKLLSNGYPNAQRLAERFHISHRQAQRDLDVLRNKLGAPVAYNNKMKGFYYTAPYTLPLLITSDNDEVYIPEVFAVSDRKELAADQSIIQMQIPYTATVILTNKLAATELATYIADRQSGNRYLCEFHSVEKFLGALFALNADFRLVEPEWLRERLNKCAERVLKNNQEAPEN